MTSPSLFEAALQERFARLAPALQEFHRLSGSVAIRGEVEVQEPAGAFARLVAASIGAPRRGGRGELVFELDAAPGQETWTRRFPGSTMTSVLRPAAGGVVETLGGARLMLRLEEAGTRLRMELAGLTYFGVPVPRWLLPQISAQETGSGRRVLFDVSVSWPARVLVARYRGHLDLDSVRAR